MLYAFKLGPFDSNEGPLSVYVGITEAGMVPGVWADDDGEGLRGVKEHVWGEELACEPRLSRAGKALGYRGRKLPDWVLEPRAQLALTLLFAGQLPDEDIDAYLELVLSCARLAEAQPWRWWHDEQPISVQISGVMDQRFEACLLGGAGLTHGLALYDRAGAVSRIAQLIEDGDSATAELEDCLVVTLGSGPRFAVKALSDAYGLSAVPSVVRARSGKRGMASRTELLALAAAARACADLTPDLRHVAIDGQADGERVGAEVTAPRPELVVGEPG